ncbi:membrane protein [Litchfieldella anticariensis FP35 = DSM 16096]|uniref:Membrane protein n=1 Tax=Litchfieldella anticariensis (strain DSM 16096 / CECT 5854 / CIP 108499 / LMG 22089 / FP35) TaxID=1121939 RepID=S2KYQ2_LITA3|nr:tellurite resistance TerB family protein [Halomonas anticariensis]EPC00519.1 membrane protein [Halomonas anticariensis FP35 = DSM 16096]
MNAKGILDQLMKQAGGSKSQGGGFDVDRLMKGLSSQVGSGQGQAGGSGVDMKSLLGGGALGMLIGSKRGRKMGGKALKYGAIAGVGMLAWKAWQNYQSGQGDDAREGQPLERLQGQQQEQRSLEILQAMIMAARADGHIDENERAQLTEQIDSMGADEELHAWVERQFQAPLDAEALAKQADSPQAAREIYLASVAMIDDQNPMERAWLDQLAQALGLEPAMTTELERQALAAAE